MGAVHLCFIFTYIPELFQFVYSLKVVSTEKKKKALKAIILYYTHKLFYCHLHRPLDFQLSKEIFC